jgi:hypothetical protein
MPYEDTAIRIAEEKSCASGKDDGCGGAGIARGKSSRLAGDIMGADYRDNLQMLETLHPKVLNWGGNMAVMEIECL